MLADSSVNQLDDKAKAMCISATSAPHAPSDEAVTTAAPTLEGPPRLKSIEFSATERENLRKLLFAVLTGEEVGQEETATCNFTRRSSISSWTSGELDSSDETATTCDFSDGEFSEDEFSDDDAK
jgi:hypothetical protein